MFNNNISHDDIWQICPLYYWIAIYGDETYALTSCNDYDTNALISYIYMHFCISLHVTRQIQLNSIDVPSPSRALVSYICALCKHNCTAKIYLHIRVSYAQIQVLPINVTLFPLKSIYLYAINFYS